MNIKRRARRRQRKNRRERVRAQERLLAGVDKQLRSPPEPEKLFGFYSPASAKRLRTEVWRNDRGQEVRVTHVLRSMPRDNTEPVFIPPTADSQFQGTLVTLLRRRSLGP